jgi:hypothetical protein
MAPEANAESHAEAKSAAFDSQAIGPGYRDLSPGHNQENEKPKDWTEITAKDAYTPQRPFVAESGSKVNAIDSSVDAKFGALVIAGEYSNVIAQAGSKVEAFTNSKIEAKAGSDVTLHSGAFIHSAQPGTRFTIADGGYDRVERGISTEVQKGGLAFASAGSETHVQQGGEVIADSGAKVKADFGAKVRAKQGAELSYPQDTDVRIVDSSGLNNTVPAGAKTVFDGQDVRAEGRAWNGNIIAESGSEVEVGEKYIVDARAGSKVHVMAGGVAVAETGATVVAEDRARVIAKPGSHVLGTADSIVGSADANLDFSRIARNGIDNLGLGLRKNMHLYGDGAQIGADAGKVEVVDAKNIVVKDGGKIVAAGTTVARAESGAEVLAAGGSEVHAAAGAHVTAGYNSTVYAESGSNVEAGQGSHVIADRGADVLVDMGATVEAKNGANVHYKDSWSDRFYETWLAVGPRLETRVTEKD